jgi:hypothetical protein
MVDLKEAVKIARDFMTDLYDGDRLSGLLLEEVELSGDEKSWLITFGFDTNRPTLEPDSTHGGLRLSSAIAYPKYVREYKTIKVRAEDGKPESMKIRKL